MVRYLLDTNVVSELARSEPQERVGERYRAHEHESALSSVVWHELLYGVERLPAGRRRDVLMQYEETLYSYGGLYTYQTVWTAAA